MFDRVDNGRRFFGVNKRIIEQAKFEFHSQHIGNT